MKIKTEEITSKLLSKNDIKLYVKRIDLIDKYISGNKWYKLKYNIKSAINNSKKCVLTYGGAYSNHLLATAVISNQHNLKSIGLVRGEKKQNLNPILRLVEQYGMHVDYISRSYYRMRDDKNMITDLKRKYGDFYLIPQGGTNNLGVKGAQEILTDLDSQSYICVPVATGGTISGIINSSNKKQKILGFKTLKGVGDLEENIKKFTNNNNWNLLDDYTFGGFAKYDTDLVNFIKDFDLNYSIKLDIIYTSKMMYGLFDLIRKGYFKRKSSILAIHTGGLQGNLGMNERFNLNLPQ
tara:strand:+ start:1665 stop:2549 length:885 start_codon:yes stop_codon:yes gene_type:complete